MLNTYLQGFAVSLSLIVAIGAQNAFVLKQGLKKQSVFWVCFACALSDSILIAFGVAGFSAVLQRYPEIIQFAKWGGAVFLLWYGFQHAVQAVKSQQFLLASQTEENRLAQIILLCLALTWLNPHVYLDTVVLLGSIGSQQADDLRPLFAAGAITASIVWFVVLGYGARLLVPLFSRPMAWRVLDALVALMLWGIAASLLLA